MKNLIMALALGWWFGVTVGDLRMVTFFGPFDTLRTCLEMQVVFVESGSIKDLARFYNEVGGDYEVIGCEEVIVGEI